MTSDHYFSKTDLEGTSSRVQNGQSLQFDAEQVEQFVATLKTAGADGRSVGLFLFGLFAIAVVLIVTVIYVIARFVLK